MKWWHHPYGRKWRRTKKPLDESERGEWKSWLKAQQSNINILKIFCFPDMRFFSPKLHITYSNLVYYTAMCICSKSLQWCPTLFDSMDYSLPGSSVHGILQARILEWVAMPFSRGSSQPRDWTQVSYISCIGRWVLYY